MPLTFRKKDHQYLWTERGQEPRPVPSVTQILRRTIGMDWVTPEALQNGTRIHDEIAAALTSDGKYTASFQPHTARALRFIEETEAQVLAVEKMIHHPTLWYAGMLDVVLRIGVRIVLPDWKCNSCPKTVGLQLAAYKEAVNVEGLFYRGRKAERIDSVAVVILHADKYEFIQAGDARWPSDHKTDFQNFQKCLEAYNEHRAPAACAELHSAVE